MSMSMTMKAEPLPPSGSAQKSRIAGLIGACAGNLVEWFDFFAYAYTSIYFASAFFPSGDQTSQLLATAGIFAVGFFMRPLGGWLFGWLADTRGRKLSMMIAVSLMCTGSLMIAVLPTYQTIGIAAPILLLIARLLQGLSVGAEYGTGATYISEISTAGRRGFFGSFQYFTIIVGQLLALFTVVILQQTLSPEDLKAWGWRIPFILGALGAVVVVYLRRSMVETASQKDMHQKEAGSISGLLGNHKRALGLVIAFTAGGSLYFYTFTTYMQKFLVVSAKLNAETVSIVMTAALICFMLCQPIFGMLADKVGVRTNMRLFAGLATVFAVPILYALKSVASPYAAFGLVVSGLVIGSFYTAVSGLVKADLFPTTVRCLGVGLPYAIANAMFGGTAEYAALWLRSVGVETYFFFYVAGLTGVAFVATMLMPDLFKHGFLDGDGEVEEHTGLKG